VTQLVLSLHQSNAAEDETKISETCAMPSAIEMHITGSKTGAKKKTASSRNNATRGTMIIMVPSTANLTDNAPLKEGAMKEESMLSPTI
jgi:hypothetical protein